MTNFFFTGPDAVERHIGECYTKAYLRDTCTADLLSNPADPITEIQWNMKYPLTPTVSSSTIEDNRRKGPTSTCP